MIETLAAIGAFLVDHADLFALVKDALEGGASKDQIMKDIRAAMVAASDAEMKRELGGGS